MWQSSPLLKAVHGFSNRLGGNSVAVYQGLNLSTRVGDLESTVLENRRIALAALNLQPEQVVLLRQIHSSTVFVAGAVPAEPPIADAVVTAQKGIALVIETADCYPVLLEDKTAGVIAAAHCGWRGTAGRILEQTVQNMVTLGASTTRIQAAIGPGICAAQYEVRMDVLERFLEMGFPETSFMQSEDMSESGSRLFHLDLAAANRWLLEKIGVPKKQIWVSGQCSTETPFFSYRRDHGQTGRMWSLISQ